MVRPVRCVQKHGADVVKVPDSECPANTAPNAVEKCNLQHCPARYESSLHCNADHMVYIINTKFMGQITEQY